MSNPNAGTSGSKEINKDYPQESGLEDDEKHEGTQVNLVAVEGSKVSKKEKAFL